MLHQEVQKSSSRNPSSEADRSRFAPRPVTVQAQEDSHKAPTQQEMENEVFGQSKVEAFGLQLKEKSGAITSEEQERLGMLQAKMADFWSQRLESASRFGYNFATIPVYSPDRPASAPVQPQVAPIQAKSTVGQPNDKVEQQPGRVARQAVEMPASVEQRSNQTGLPDVLKSGVEQLAGLSLDDVKVHYNSAKPAQFGALAYTQGSHIHIAPGQERHLAHEAWHVIQQAQGRVTPTMQMKNGVPVNDDQGLEHEADEMGARALQICRAVQITTGPLVQATTAEPRGIEPTENSAVPSTTVGASGDKARLNSLSTLFVQQQPRAAAAGSRIPNAGNGHTIQRKCDQGHPYHADGPCPFSEIDPPRRKGGGGLKSIYTTPSAPDTGLNYLSEAAQHAQQGVGSLYGGPVEVLRAPQTPIAHSVPTRYSGNTATAFRQGTGDNSAREHMERHGYPSAPRAHNVTHIGGYGQHGLSADNPQNVVAARMAANGTMIPTDNRYPPGFISLNEAEVEQGTHVAHRITMAVAHPDQPDVPLFRDQIDAFRSSLTREEWDQRDAWARRNLTTENLNTAHAMNMLNPGGHPTMDQIRDEEDTERTAAILHDLGGGRSDDEDDNMDLSS